MSKVLDLFSHRILTPTEEIELGKILVIYPPNSQQYEHARTTLLECNLRLVAKAANEFSKMTRLDLDDLIGEGYLGLINAVEKYNPTLYTKSRFATYALHWIRQKMRLFANKNLVAHVPIAMIGKMSKYKRIISEQPEGDLLQEDLIKKMEVNEKTLSIIKSINVRSVSMSSTDAGSTVREISFEDTLEDHETMNSYDIAEKNDKISIVRSILETLNEMDRDIVMLQYMEDDKVCLKDIGVKYGLSTERIRQIKEQTLIILKERLKKEKKIMYA